MHVDDLLDLVGLAGPHEKGCVRGLARACDALDRSVASRFGQQGQLFEAGIKGQPGQLDTDQDDGGALKPRL